MNEQSNQHTYMFSSRITPLKNSVLLTLNVHIGASIGDRLKQSNLRRSAHDISLLNQSNEE